MCFLRNNIEAIGLYYIETIRLLESFAKPSYNMHSKFRGKIT